MFGTTWKASLLLGLSVLAVGAEGLKMRYDWEKQEWKGKVPRSLVVPESGQTKALRFLEGSMTPFKKDKKYYRVRVPVATVTKNGTIVVASEGRLGHNPAHPPGTDRDWDHLLVSRSTDLGKTWKTKVIAGREGNWDIGALSICADKKGDGRLMILAYGAGKGEKNPVHIFESRDDGKSWKKHHQSPARFAKSEKAQPVRMRPTHGIQLKSGENEGDFLVPGVVGYNEKRHMGLLRYDYAANEWSLDKSLGEVPGARFAGEMSLAEVEGGRLFFLTRPELSKETVKRKKQLYYDLEGKASSEGWVDSPFSFKRCNQSLRTYRTKKGKECVLLSSTYNRGGQRYGGHLSVSFNGGKTWKSKAIASDKTYFGYSQVLALPDGSIGVIYEGKNSKGKDNCALWFKRVSFDWLKSK